MKVLDKNIDSISVEAISEGKLMMTIHGLEPVGNRNAILSVRETKILAYALLAEAEKIVY